MANTRKMLIEPVDSHHPNASSAAVAASSIGSHMPFAASRKLLPALALLWFTGAWGGVASDPTRPPPAWLAAQPSAQGTVSQANQQSEPGLQLIVVGPTRRFAVIDGEVVKPGDAFNGSKVLHIDAGQVVVQDPSKSLKLTPAVEKKVNVPSSPGKHGKAASKRKPLVNRDGGTL